MVTTSWTHSTYSNRAFCFIRKDRQFKIIGRVCNYYIRLQVFYPFFTICTFFCGFETTIVTCMCNIEWSVTVKDFVIITTTIYYHQNIQNIVLFVTKKYRMRKNHKKRHNPTLPGIVGKNAFVIPNMWREYKSTLGL